MAERLGRVAKVASEQSFLRCSGQPPAQRDAGYRANSGLSIKFVFDSSGPEFTSGGAYDKRSYVQNKGVGADTGGTVKIRIRGLRQRPRAAQQPSF